MPAPPSVLLRRRPWLLATLAAALAGLPGAATLCLSDGAGHISPAALGRLVEAVAASTGRLNAMMPPNADVGSVASALR